MNRKLKILLNYFLAPLIFVVLSWSLYTQIIRQPDIEIRWQHISEHWNQWKFWLVLLLMVVNWGIEARKWQVLVHHVQQFTWWSAFNSVRRKHGNATAR